MWPSTTCQNLDNVRKMSLPKMFSLTFIETRSQWGCVGANVWKSNGSRWVVCLFDPKDIHHYSLVWPSKTFQNLQNVKRCHLSPWECVGENVSNGWRWVTRLVSCDLHCRKLFIILNISSEYTLQPQKTRVRHFIYHMYVHFYTFVRLLKAKEMRHLYSQLCRRCERSPVPQGDPTSTHRN